MIQSNYIVKLGKTGNRAILEEYIWKYSKSKKKQFYKVLENMQGEQIKRKNRNNNEIMSSK